MHVINCCSWTLHVCSQLLYSSLFVPESPEVRQAQLQHRREQRAMNPDVQFFEQASVHTKMMNFHSKLLSLEFHTCTSCLERFPNLAMAAYSSECSRCSRDTRIPKLYSPANNMDPGPIPSQLQVNDIKWVLLYRIFVYQCTVHSLVSCMYMCALFRIWIIMCII